MIPEQSCSGVPGEQDAHPINRSNKFAIPYIVKDLPQTRHHRGGFMPKKLILRALRARKISFLNHLSVQPG
jgi:hypothetical protein